MSELKPFCNGCGLCCQKMGKWVEIAQNTVVKDKLTREMSKFPYAWDENGRCEKLGPDNKCTVYYKRPDICSIEKIFEKHYYMKINRSAFYAQSEDACIKLGALKDHEPTLPATG